MVGPVDGKPVMLDDTCYFVSCRSIEEAEFIVKLFNSEVASVLLESMIFRTNKRPVTAELLKRLHIGKLAAHLDRTDEYEQFVNQRNVT